ncbi:acetylglucosamine transferase [Paucibacter sp. APW11]|uniref:protein O-GlcNAc transferase n=1 Tax=Roseateles aquae TaxID=3077235 RepID=A0ABU3P9D8_9BURK|nr:tetratricopeptide repeat protein [Paucibacter sp. APW11]MDT8998835.1 acetylglucosamine transferase [Paucibacter sp. APW11]
MDISRPAAATPAPSPDPAATVAASPADERLAQVLARSRSGQMQLPELLDTANQLHATGMAEASAQLYESWIAATDSPLRHIACFNWGTVLGTLKRPVEAERAYRHAIELQPEFAQAYLNLGHQLEQQGRNEEALAAWREVAEKGTGLQNAGPEAPQLRLHAINNMARLLEMLKRYDESEPLMRLSLELKGDQSDVMQHYVHIRQKQCAWPVYQTMGKVSHNQLLCATSLLATLSASDDPALQLMTAQRFVHEKVVKYSETPYHRLAVAANKPREGRIKVGYLSGDLCMHAVGLLSAELYELHNRDKFEVFAFSWSREDGTPLRARLKAAMDHYIPIGHLDDKTAARLIAASGIDVLVDLQGLTSGARPNILAYRPAPIQVGYLGLPATSALPGVDWIIADRFVMQPEYLPYCSEKPIYLPHCYQVSDRTRPIGAEPTRAQYGIPEDAFLFCSFNNNHKIGEETFAAWMRILGEVENSVLWLLADNPWAQKNLQAEAERHGIDAKRLIFAPRVSPADYLARFRLPDLVLDTFPYNAGTTASDCLWVGTPILTRSGRTYISRMAGSLLHAVGLPDLVTYSLDDYVKLAVQIGKNPARARSYKRFLREEGRNSPLFDLPTIVRDLENEFERLALDARADGQL